MLWKYVLGGGALPLVLCNHMRIKGIFMGIIYLFIWILGNPLSRQKKLYQIFSTL